MFWEPHVCRGRGWSGLSPVSASQSPAADAPSCPAEVATKFCQPLEPVSGELGGTVTLVCELSPPQAEVVWRCGSTQLRAGKRFQIEATGPRRCLTVSGLRLEDAGEYTCETRNDRTSAQLTVNGTQWRATYVGGRAVGQGMPGRLPGGDTLIHNCRVRPLKENPCPQPPARSSSHQS